MPKAYTPINCNFYDLLLEIACRQEAAQIVFKDGAPNRTFQVSEIINDIITRKGEEFMILSNGAEYRLDRVISVNGIQLEGFCSF